MPHPRIPAMRNQALIGVSLLVLSLWAAWQIGGKIAGGDLAVILFATLGFAACAVAVAILRNWRSGFYLFLVWLLFEDLVRKYLGNGTALFFGKDILVGLIYVSFFVTFAGKSRRFCDHHSYCRLLCLCGWRRHKSSIRTPQAFYTVYWASNCTSTMFR